MKCFPHQMREYVQCARRYAVAVLLVLALGGHQGVMASPLHAHVMATGVFAAVPSPAPHPHTSDAGGAGGTDDGATEPHHLAPCPVEEARLVALVALPPPFLAVVALLAFSAAWSRVGFSDSRWLWPPNRRRALLQVFLC